jgi:cold shock protein
MESTQPELCKIVDAHYFRGRLSAGEAAKAAGDVLFYERLFDDVLNAEGVTQHHLPLSRAGKGKKKEKGVDVLFALEAYERALHQEFDVVVLIAADGDYIPLVKKLHALGTRVMVLGWDLEHEGEQKKEPTTTYTSFELLEEATYPVMMNELIDSRAFRSDPIINGLFVAKSGADDRLRDTKGRPYQAPTARTRPVPDPTELKEADTTDQDGEAEVKLAEEPQPELTMTVQESLPTPEVKVVGKIQLPDLDEHIKRASEPLPEISEGYINALKAGFGFIDVGLGENAFFHYKSLSGVVFNNLSVGDHVELELDRNEKGQLIAKNVTLIPD